MGVQRKMHIVECRQETPESVDLGIVPIHLSGDDKDRNSEETEGRG